MSYEYTTTSIISDTFGNRITFGTSGTSVMTQAQGTRNIERVCAVIDHKLSPIYGTMTPLFGTNAWGTTDTPQVIKDIATDMATGVIYENVWNSITLEQMAWGSMIYMRGYKLLLELSLGESILKYSGTIETDGVPQISNEYKQIRGEKITLNGTNLIDLKNKMVIKKNMTCYGTSIDNPTTYVEGSAYKVFYYNNDITGNNWGKIKSLGTLNGDVYVDYWYYTPRNFILNDTYHWGESSQEKR